MELSLTECRYPASEGDLGTHIAQQEQRNDPGDGFSKNGASSGAHLFCLL